MITVHYELWKPNKRPHSKFNHTFLSEMFSSCILFPNALSIHYLILMQMCCPILRILGNQDEFEIFIKKTVDQPTYLEPVWADLKK